MIDWRVVRWSLGFGIPATVVGAIATRWIGGSALVTLTDAILVALGLRFLLARSRDDGDPVEPQRDRGWLLALVATTVGLVSGLPPSHAVVRSAISSRLRPSCLARAMNADRSNA